MKYGTIPPMRVAHRPSVRPGILSLGSHPCFFILLFYFLLACSIVFLLNTAAFPSFQPFFFFFSRSLSVSLSIVYSAVIITAISSLFLQWLYLFEHVPAQSQWTDPSGCKIRTFLSSIFYVINSPVMQCQLNQRIWITMINDLFFPCYLAAGAETRGRYDDVDTDVWSCSMAVLY